jgi:hypothetical protein
MCNFGADMRALLLILAIALAATCPPLPVWADDDGEEFEELFDPGDAEKYRREQTPVTADLDEAATPAVDEQGDEEATSQPANPFADTPQSRRDLMPGYIELSDGRLLPGRIYTTRDKPWSVYDAKTKTFRRIPPVVVRRIEAEMIWERDTPQWRWKEGGSDEKVYTGRTYPARKIEYTFTLINGMKISGTVQQPIYVRHGDGEAARMILHERQKGALGQTLEDLVYVRRVELGKAALAEGRERLAENPPTSQPADNEPETQPDGPRLSQPIDPARIARRIIVDNPTDLDVKITALADTRGVRVRHLGGLRFEVVVLKAEK